jgi:hypothetical protein
MNWATWRSSAFPAASTFCELPLNGIAGHAGIVSVAMDAVLAVGADVAVVLSVAVEVGAATMTDGGVLAVAIEGPAVTDALVRGAVGSGFLGVAVVEPSGCADTGEAPAPTITIRTPGMVLTAAIASARAVRVSAHTYASLPENTTVAVRCRAPRAVRAWSVRSACIAWAVQYVPKHMVAASPAATSAPPATRRRDTESSFEVSETEF